MLGKNPGVAHVKAMLLDTLSPVSTEADIIVIEPLRLEPFSATILPWSTLLFRLQARRMAVWTDKSMPCEQ